MLNRRTLGPASLALLLACSMALGVRGADIFIDPSGANDLLTFNNAIAAANPGDTIFVHGGTYNLNSTISIAKAGNSANPIKMLAVEGETPILNFSAQGTGGRGVSLNTAADWWHFKGLTIENAGDNGLYAEGDFNTFEQLVTRYNRDSGLQLHNSASNNLVLNCDSYENFDAVTNGENADGFALKHEDVGPGNIFRGNRAWGNSDDGFDLFYTVDYGILIEDCWTFDNGIDLWGVANYQGDGNGFKLGTPGGPSVLVNVLAVDNEHFGININGNTSGVQVYNSTTLRNDPNWRFNQAVSSQILKNNISYDGDSSDNIHSAVSDSFNSWNGGVALDDDDFVSLERFVNSVDLLKAPRKADGSLPDLGEFLKLAEGSDLIDAGTPISFTFNGITYNLPYSGTAPDMGAFEFVPSTGLMGDYNNNNIVDAADYTMWRDAMTGGGSLLNDPTPESVSESDFTYWREHFGNTSGGGAGSASAVPEPGTLGMMLVAAGVLVGRWRRRGL